MFSPINIFGLSLGIAFAMLIGAFVWSELRVNQQLRNAASQYFLESNWKDPNMGNAITTVGPLAKRLKEDYPSLVANYYRWDGITSVVSNGDKFFRENIQLGDSTLLSMFGFSLLHGNAKNALTAPFSVVITKAMAIKYFGKTDVTGESVNIQSFNGGIHAFTITGVLAPQKENSVTQLNTANHNNFFIPTNTYSYFGRTDFESWSNIYLPSYIELRPGVTAKDLFVPIKRLIDGNAPDFVKTNLSVRPILLKDYYLNNNNGLAKRMLYTLSLIGLFLLLMAVVNFINIAISSAGSRTREMGVRKVLGGLRAQLIVQFLTESVILVSVASLLALVMYPLAGNAFSAMVGKQVPSLGSFPPYFMGIPVLLIVVLSAFAGMYPAMLLSGLKTVDALKGKLKTVKENILLRKSLVAFQFAVALLVLIAASVITKQVNHFFSQSIGYEKEYVVSSQVPRDWTKKGVQKMNIIRNEFARLPEVRDVTLSYEIPNGMNGGEPAVYKTGADSTTAITMQAMVTDEHYLSTYQIALKNGQFFKGQGMDSGKIVLNEQAAHALGYRAAEDAVGRQVRIPGDATVFTIQGVTSDFHFGSMQARIPPMVIFNVEFATTYRYLSFKLRPGNTSMAIEAIQRKWASLLPGSSFEYQFMDDSLAQLYAAELQLKKAAYTATVLSMVIMLLGILGLVALSIQHRVKEIGIRKVLGASVISIIALFIKEFMIIMVLAAAVAIPAASFIMTSWLSNYAYRITVTPMPFIFGVAALACLTIVLVTVQTTSAALANPVKSLKTE